MGDKKRIEFTAADIRRMLLAAGESAYLTIDADAIGDLALRAAWRRAAYRYRDLLPLSKAVRKALARKGRQDQLGMTNDGLRDALFMVSDDLTYLLTHDRLVGPLADARLSTTWAQAIPAAEAFLAEHLAVVALLPS